MLRNFGHGLRREDKVVADGVKKEVVYLPVERIRKNEWNPNVQKDNVFNALVENIREIGFVEPIMVKPEEDETYLLISGEHRWEAAKVLGFVEIPAYVMDEFDEDLVKFQTVRMNVLRGKLDPVRFTKLFDNMAEKYGQELTKQMMGMVDEQAFEELYIDVKRNLPDEIAEKLDDARDEIKTVDDLSRILNELFSKYGDTLHQNFMILTYGGMTHLWVQMSKKLKDKLISQIVEELKASSLDISVFFELLLQKAADDVIQDMIDQGIGYVDTGRTDEDDVQL